MSRQLTVGEIEAACLQLLRSRRVTVRDVVRLLRNQHGSRGRTERVAGILRRVDTAVPVPVVGVEAEPEVRELRAALARAEERALRAEELERRHQDFWAARYGESRCGGFYME